MKRILSIEIMERHLFNRFLITFYVALMILISPMSHAATISLSHNEILDFEQIHINGQYDCAPPYLSMTDGCSFITNISDTGVAVTFLTYFELQSGPASADVGNDDFGVNWNEYDTYAQSILNRDENAWSFSLSVKDSTGSIANSGTYLLDKDEQAIFSVDLLELDLQDPIAEIWVTVSGNIPEPGNDAVIEWDLNFELGEVSEIPVPSSIWLFLSAMLSTFGYRRLS